jgi:chromate transporter
MSDRAPAQSPTVNPTLTELFVAFAACSIVAFGGVLPWARRMVVEQRRWMTPEEFNEAFSLSQFLPGPNIVNFSFVFGSRFRGLTGALVALAGLMGPPIVIVTILGALYFHYGDLPTLGRALNAISAAAGGLIIATVAKMALPVFQRGLHWSPVILILCFVAVGPLHLPLQWVLLVLAPAGVALAWVKR